MTQKEVCADINVALVCSEHVPDEQVLQEEGGAGRRDEGATLGEKREEEGAAQIVTYLNFLCALLSNKSLPVAPWLVYYLLYCIEQVRYGSILMDSLSRLAWIRIGLLLLDLH